MELFEAIIAMIAIAIPAAGLGVTWFIRSKDRAEHRRQREQEKIEKEKEKRENESPFGRTVAAGFG